MPTPREIVDRVRSVNPDALRNLTPVAIGVSVLDGFDPSDPGTLTERSVIIEPIVHPLLEAQLELSGATRRGRATWSYGLGEDTDVTPIQTLLRAVRPGNLVSKRHAATTRGPKEIFGEWAYNDMHHLTVGMPHHASAVFNANRNQFHGQFGQRGQAAGHGMVVLSTDTRVMWASVHTHQLTLPEDLPQVPLDLWAAGRARVDARPQIGADAVAALDWIEQAGFTIVDHSGTDAVAALRFNASRCVAAWPIPGRPAEASASVGRMVPAKVRKALGAETPEGTRAASVVEVTASAVAGLAGDIDEARLAVHPLVSDVVSMEASVPVDDERLRDYQRIAVGRHLATSFGFVNSLAPGMGKTVTTYAGMRLRSQARKGYRALVIVEANVRTQWRNEATIWFPEAKIISIETSAQAEELHEALEAAGDDPVVVITSYALAATAAAVTDEDLEVTVAHPALDVEDGQLALFAAEDPEVIWVTPDDIPDAPTLGVTLLRQTWDDLIADEAVGLRNTGTKLSDALWALRANSGVAIALTGTPIVRNLDDLGRMLSWARGDREMFHGVRLDKAFDVTDDEQLEGLTRALGPLVFRRDKSEISDEIPEIAAEVVKLTPTPSEKRLAGAAQAELKRAYEELMSYMELAEQTDPDNPEFAEVRESLKAARGALLGGTQLARMAASDPQSLLGSSSAGAALLIGQGLVAAAAEHGGTKRVWAVEFVRNAVANGERPLLFTEFATVAQGLIDDLTAEGLRVGAILGGGGRVRDRAVADFQAGELDVLVSTSSGERGLNLQTATMVIHFDLPWTADGVVQRTGRVERIGATSDTVKVVFPVMEGTIEDRVAGLVVARAMTSMQALDASRGVDLTKTEMGRSLSGLALSVDGSALKQGRESNLLALTRELLAA